MTQIITDNLRSSVPPAAPKSQRVCRHFARGRCTWGSSCRFSHDVERATVDDSQINQTFIGLQQQQLQKERHAILKSALDGEFEIKPYDIVGGFQRHIVQLRISSSILIPRLLSEDLLRQQLIELEGNEQVRIGGLLFLVGEPAVFWSMMQLYCLRRTTTSSKWDTMLANAKRGYVECMFFRSSVGCLSGDCPFSHAAPPPTVTLAAPLQNMATNNALLTPLLGFGVSAPPPPPPPPPATSTTTTLKSHEGKGGLPTSGQRPPQDSTRHLAVPTLTMTKTDDAAIFRDPVWGTCAVPEGRAAPEPTEGLSILWESGVRGAAEALW